VLLERDVDECSEEHVRRHVHVVGIAEHLYRASERLVGIKGDPIERDACMQFIENEVARESRCHRRAEDKRDPLVESVISRDEERAGRGDRECRKRVVDAAMVRPTLHDAPDDEPEAKKRRKRDTDEVSPIIRFLRERIEKDDSRCSERRHAENKIERYARIAIHVRQEGADDGNAEEEEEEKRIGDECIEIHDDHHDHRDNGPYRDMLPEHRHRCILPIFC